ncbi:hypothetical protein ACPOL_0231 [Acidisarcina polymorpha]|uniref:Uncharacterized protein n=1 Tax=Acidisarcina polymorpha TaxID=2211140 RepID=A0A2Z5FT09_9BACT|nr:choice-of-anchor P family protein [Acidisarcina polymorpha]AXC09616.1 hypothetical protein ACPOL_0231 [Acidisarcina polymorpha]
MQKAMSGGKTRLNRVFIGTVCAAAALTAGATPGCFANTTYHIGSAYGARVNVGSKVTLGPIAPAILPTCDTQSVGTFTASAASISQAPLLSTGLVDTSSSSTATSSKATSDVFGVNLLGGVISANEIKAVSTTTVDESGVYHFSSAGSEFSNLSVLGLPVAANPAPNTTIDLPGIGSVILNEQITKVESEESALTVNMIHVKVTIANELFKLGTEIIISDASSELRLVKGLALVGGYAYSPQLTTGSVSSGPLVRELIPCAGTNGAVETDSVASTNIPGVVTTGTVTVTGSGNINHAEATSEATTSVAGVNLLSGLVSATAVAATANAITTNETSFDFSGGSTFTGISVAGHPEITVNVHPNTMINVANLGVLYFNRVLKFSDKIKIVPIELIVNTKNTLGLPVGADLTIGAAEAQLHSASIP